MRNKHRQTTTVPMYRYNMPVFTALCNIGVAIAWLWFMGHCFVGLFKHFFL